MELKYYPIGNIIVDRLIKLLPYNTFKRFYQHLGL